MELSPQEVFDTAVSGVIKQGGPSLRYEGDPGKSRCLYRASNGRKCAAGQLIPDDVYREHMEGSGIGVLIKRHPVLGFLDPHMNVLRELQSAHDRMYGDSDLEEFKFWCRGIALKFGLSTAILD